MRFEKKNYCQRIHYTELAHVTRHLVVKIDLFVWNDCLLVLKTEDDDQTASNEVEAKNKRRLEKKDQMARCMVCV